MTFQTRHTLCQILGLDRNVSEAAILLATRQLVARARKAGELSAAIQAHKLGAERFAMEASPTGPAARPMKSAFGFAPDQLARARQYVAQQAGGEERDTRSAFGYSPDKLAKARAYLEAQRT